MVADVHSRTIGFVDTGRFKICVICALNMYRVPSKHHKRCPKIVERATEIFTACRVILYEQRNVTRVKRNNRCNENKVRCFISYSSILTNVRGVLGLKGKSLLVCTCLKTNFEEKRILSAFKDQRYQFPIIHSSFGNTLYTLILRLENEEISRLRFSCNTKTSNAPFRTPYTREPSKPNFYSKLATFSWK